jgi:hypothetical protein
VDPRFVSRGVPEHPEGSPQKIGKAALFAALARRAARIDRQERGISAKNSVYQSGSVIGQTYSTPHLFRPAFHRLLDSVEIVVGQQLRPAEMRPTLVSIASTRSGPVFCNSKSHVSVQQTQKSFSMMVLATPRAAPVSPKRATRSARSPVAGFIGFTGNSYYAASKQAVEGFSDTPGDRGQAARPQGNLH